MAMLPVQSIQALLFMFVVSSGGLLNFAQAQSNSPNACRAHDPQNSEVPACPPKTGQSQQMLADNYYPAMAVAVNDYAGKEFFVDFIMKALKAQPDRPPQFLMTTVAFSGSVSALKEAIRKEAPDQATREKWLASLTSVGGRTWNWQQDFTQATIDPATGRPVLREVSSMRYFDESFLYPITKYVAGTPFENLSKTAKETCDVKTGEEIDVPGAFRTGLKGGNIEATAGGLCLIGNASLDRRQWRDLAKSVCGNADNAIEVPTSFLAVGHADEVVSTIRVPNKQAPCDYAVMVASPSAAIEVLNTDRGARFMNFPGMSSADSAKRYRSDDFPYAAFCRQVFEFQSQKETPLRAPDQRGRNFSVYEILVPKAFGGSDRGLDECVNLTNGDVVDFLKSNEDLALVNLSIQNRMSAFKRQLTERLKRAIPGCEPDIIDVPQFFDGRLLRLENTATAGSNISRSIIPNPTNGVQIASTLITPEPGNAAIRAKLEEELSKRGVRLDTMDTSVLNGAWGQIHCATNAMRYCRPVDEPPRMPTQEAAQVQSAPASTGTRSTVRQAPAQRSRATAPAPVRQNRTQRRN